MRFRYLHPPKKRRIVPAAKNAHESQIERIPYPHMNTARWSPARE
jgi:hypothetical protein